MHQIDFAVVAVAPAAAADAAAAGVDAVGLPVRAVGVVAGVEDAGMPEAERVPVDPAGASTEIKQRTERVADAAAMSGECLPERLNAARRILDGKEDWPGGIGEIESVRPTRQIGTTPRRDQSAADGESDEHLGAGLREANHEARARPVAAACVSSCKSLSRRSRCLFWNC